ncbi:hypothetical protein COCSUDRAFT_44263 [Coccomyxa subellipsoidea C-169]|uniref:Uncharacterized protein n=1 Tax=Coccomyxa subellipsoidea (strain C-169) TaxID=574566 RepID=I0YN68_COCSC|nr:hypothetical protein COCSUDRAFT_44263 [Coccomyxa subellipsoidea C-169]EIE19837.1 hypothetical protein COCSUDRAFT_44263 [Coccomyxa subellipsoidea C-169]|eukprot:XP_005644381.1 hypothetical protein COCSUDRAFT_44263 [Coccomyxa subellipsoidea C-169]
MRRTAFSLLVLFQFAAPGLCADSRRHLTQGGPQQPPLLPLPALGSYNAQQQAYLPQLNQPGPQQSFAAAQQQQQQQLLRQQQQQQTQPNTSFDNLVKTAAPTGGPGLAQAPAWAPAPAITSFSALAPAEGNGCTQQAAGLVTGACFDFLAPFRADYGRLAAYGDAEFRQAVALGATPSDACCEDAREFVSETCGCDVRVASAAPALGMRPEAFPLVAKALVMACPRYNIVDPCRQSTASTTAFVVFAPLLEEHVGDVVSAFEFVTQNGILADTLLSSAGLINAPSTLLLDFAFTAGAYSQPGPISMEPGFAPVPPSDQDISAAEIREIARSFAHLPLLPVNSSSLDAAIASFPGPEAADANVTIQSVQKTAETAALETITSMQAKLAALKAVDVSSLSPADSETHRLDVRVLELQIEDEQSYLETVRSYLPSLQQDPDGDGYVEADLAVPLAPSVTGRRLQQATPSTAQTLERSNKEVTQNLQKLIETKFTQRFGEELIRSVAKGAVSGILSKIPVPIVGEVLGNLFGTLIDPPPEEPCDLTCTWEALKSRAKDLVKSLLRVEDQRNLERQLADIRARWQAVKVYDGLTSCSPPGTAPETRREQYGVRVTALDGTLVGAEGRYLPQVRNKTPDFSRDAAAYLNYLTATKSYVAAVAAARQAAINQRRAAVTIVAANCGVCREPFANFNYYYRDFDVSVTVKDSFVNEGSETKHFVKCVNLPVSDADEPGNPFFQRSFTFNRACGRVQRQNIDEVQAQQDRVFALYERQLDDFLKPTLLWAQSFDPFAVPK